jgi:hypothetical protein
MVNGLQKQYDRLVTGFREFNEQPRKDLELKIKLALLAMRLPRNKTKLHHEELIDGVYVDLESEKKRLDGLYINRDKAEIKQELTSLENAVLPHVPPAHAAEVRHYFDWERALDVNYRDAEFIDGVKAVHPHLLLPYLSIAFAHRNPKNPAAEPCIEVGFAGRCLQEIQKKLPAILNALPPQFVDDYVNVLLQAQQKNIISASVLLELLSRQLGVLRATSHPPSLVPSQHQAFYMAIAKMHASSPALYDILEALPGLIEKNGMDETRRIAGVAACVRDEDFPDEYNVALVYLGKKAGDTFCGDEGGRDRKSVV